MQKSILLLGAAILALSTSPALAQSLYGEGSLGVYSGEVTDNAAIEGTNTVYDINGYVGFGFSSDMFIEAETRLQFGENSPATNDSLSKGTMFAVRAGRDFGTFTGEIFAGAVDAETDEGSTDRYFFGLAGGYQVSSQFALTGLIGYLDGTGGTDDSGYDGFREMTHVGLGMNYAATPHLTIDGNIFYGSGIMDDNVVSGFPPDDDGEVLELSLGATYALPRKPNLEFYGRVTYMELDQPDESDTADDTQFAIGMNWTFGNTSSRDRATRADLPRYADWLATSAGVLE